MFVKRRVSGLQLQVLHLYRSLLRAALKKPEETRIDIYDFVRFNFRTSASSVSTRKDHAAIEHLIRQGKKRLELLESPSLTSITLPVNPEFEHMTGRHSHRRQRQQQQSQTD
ncbi:hypothetical protein BC829DRAFT_443331 [Chytridium lagenaria]|nr:hypothetical protein BC829DRAFT_443331 [Chytridium lagenaria]